MADSKYFTTTKKGAIIGAGQAAGHMHRTLAQMMIWQEQRPLPLCW